MRGLKLCSVALTALVSLTACEGADPGGAFGPAAPEDGVPEEVASVLDLPGTPYSYAGVTLPAHFNTPAVRDMDNTPSDNPLTDEGATLGRVLFYDTALSANRTVACATCHLQERAFSDVVALSEGFDGGLTGRNTMPIVDSRFYRSGRFFWDERADTLEEQVLMPIQNEVEMGLTLDELVERVSAQPYAPYLFTQAFGDDQVTSDRISKALAQFARAIVSYRSRFDEGVVATGDVRRDFPGFTPQENQGKDLFFRSGCAACHLDNGPPQAGGPQPGPLANQAIFFVNRATSNGLPQIAGAPDNGAGDITGDPRDDGAFKSPSLRNVALTAPYMHDGRFGTLEEVIAHYNDGVEISPNLDPRLIVPGSNPPEPRRLNLAPADVDALAAFLRALTDEELVGDEKFADPFL